MKLTSRLFLSRFVLVCVHYKESPQLVLVTFSFRNLISAIAMFIYFICLSRRSWGLVYASSQLSAEAIETNKIDDRKGLKNG